jgi:hypothetical protein
MKIEQLFLTKLKPYFNDFKSCEIYKHEINKIEQDIAESINQKNIYAALDIPDFKITKDLKLETRIIELACKKLKLGNEILFLNENGAKKIIIDGMMYQSIIFQSGVLPKIDLKHENIIFFMVQPMFKRVYYCGALELNKLTKKEYNDFYQKYCFEETKIFVNFNLLTL